jgi:tRNA1(Val) A37 N6-methylase TrmN6
MNMDESVCIARQEVSLNMADLVQKAWKLVRPGGKFLLIYPIQRLDELFTNMAKTGFIPLRLRFIHSKADKPARAFLLEAGKDAGRSLTVEKPLILHNENGSYTEELSYVLKGGCLGNGK